MQMAASRVSFQISGLNRCVLIPPLHCTMPAFISSGTYRLCRAAIATFEIIFKTRGHVYSRRRDENNAVAGDET